MTESPTQPTVAIAGGGLAGLAASKPREERSDQTQRRRTAKES
jgi:cation diffusion facilitator CzcD-associated flavoprotein CzcO